MGRLLSITPSKLSQAAACIASTYPEGAVQQRSKWATRGTVLHEVAERAASAGWSAALEALPAHLDADTRRLAEEFDLEALQKELGGGFYSWGVGVMWCVQTGEGLVLGTGLTREKAHELARAEADRREGDWLVGLLDLAGQVVRDGVLWVLVPDLKTGHERPEHASSCWQTRAYAVMLASALGATEAIHGPLWMPDGKRPKWDEPETLAPDGLFEAESQLRALLLEVERVRALPLAERLAPQYGEHCKYCPREKVCSARTAVVQRFVGGEVLEVTRDNAAEAWRRIKMLRSMCDDGEAVLRQLAASEAFEVEPGTMFGPYPYEEETVRPDVLPHALGAMGLTTEQVSAVLAKAVKQSAPKTELGRVLVNVMLPDKKGRRGKVGPLNDRLDAALRRLDGYEVKKSVRVGEHAAGKTLLPAGERDGQEPTEAA